MTAEDIKAMGAAELCDKATLIRMHDTDSPFEETVLEEAALDRAKALGILARYKKLLGAFRKEFRKAQAETGQSRITYRDRDYDMGGWMLLGGAIARYSDRGGYIYACSHRILAVRRLKNLETKKEKVVLAFDRDGWEEITVPKEVVSSATKIVALSGYGIQVTSENARPLVKYLSDMESSNRIDLRNSTSKYGWHGEDFIPFDKKVAFDADSQFRPLNDSLEPKGSYEAWLGLAKEIRKYSHVHYEPQLFMAGAAASVLVRMASALPFILNIWGGTGGGKTVALMVAASVWADPAEGRFMTDALSTQNAFEAREDILNDLPLMIDDFSKVSRRFGDDFSELIYMIASGRGKSRSNIDLGLNPMKTWSNICLSNMERPLIGDNIKGGQVNRVLDFEMDGGKIFGGNGVPLSGNHVAELVKGNYGFAGRKIIRIIKETGRANIKEILKSAYEKVKKEGDRQGKNIEDKQILSFALLLVGDLIMEKIFNDGIFLDLEKCVSQLKTADDVQETRRIYDYIMDTVEQNIKKFEDDSSYHGEVWGFIKDGYVNINPNVFKKIAAEGNFSVKAFCQWADRAGILKHTENKLQNAIKVKGKTTRFYSIKISGDEEDGDGFVETDSEWSELC